MPVVNEHVRLRFCERWAVAMMKPRSVIFDQTDAATLLAKIAGELHCVQLAITGMAHQEFGPGDRSFRELMAIGDLLDRNAGLVAKVTIFLCKTCRTMDVTMSASFGAQAPRRKP